ncbi:RDD family protein [Snodgrassella alvi]|uniref:RDD family protein n=1 Tax=Snodgrassella alvi TaxID=1196083 RepID=UPI003CC8344F
MINIQLFLAPAIVMYIVLHIRPYSNIFFYITLACIIFLIIFPAWQCYWMRTRGQSIGKKIMGIRVIHLDNSSPDFWTNVIKREIIYYLYLFFLVITIFYLPDLHNEDFWNFFLLTLLKLWSSVTTLPLLFIILLVNIFNLTCLYRLLSDKFLSITLQDKLAKTKVVQNISK